MSKHDQNTIHPLDPKQTIRMLSEGFFERTIIVGEETRRILIYVPAGARPSCPGLFILGENGQSADELIDQGPWCALADQDQSREKFVLYYLEPKDGKWHTEEAYGTTNGDVAYVNAVFRAGQERLITCVHEAKFYLLGIGAGATVACMAAMDHPTVWAGLCAVGGSAVARDYIDAVSGDCCIDLHGYEDADGIVALKKAEAPLPVWRMRDSEQAADEACVLDYWKHANGITDPAKQEADGSLLFVRSTDTENPYNQEKEAYRIRMSAFAGDPCDEANRRAEAIKEFLFAQRRWMGDPGGDLQMTREPVSDIGMTYHTEIVDGWMREWYVYVPESAKDPAKGPYPLVLAMHGYSCSGELYAGDSGWHKVADRYGFILVHPTGTLGKVEVENNGLSADNIELTCWNVRNDRPGGPDENRFFRHLIEWICNAHPIDRRRIYATGHSYGSAMTQRLGITETSLFAAVAPCSGVFFSDPSLDVRGCKEVDERADGAEVPVWMFVGEREEWLFPHIPKTDNCTGETILFWQKLNHLPMEVPDADDVRWERNGVWNDIHFYNADGVPMVNYTWVRGFPHATTPEMSFRIWEEFFSQFCREEGEVKLFR